MIEDNGRIKITDFGIAMALNSTQVNSNKLSNGFSPLSSTGTG